MCKYEVWDCLLSYLEGCLLYKTVEAEFSKVVVATGKHDIGRYIPLSRVFVLFLFFISNKYLQ